MKVFFNAMLETNRPLIKAFFSTVTHLLTMTTTFPHLAKPTNTNNTLSQLSARCHCHHHPLFHQQTTTTTMPIAIKALPHLLLS
jgi:hypothetical protein